MLVSGNTATDRATQSPAFTPAPAPIPTSAPVALTITEPAARILGVLALMAIAVIHILDSVDSYDVRYIFWMYMALIAACVPVSLLLLQWPSARAWLLTGLLGAAPLIAYVVTRTVGLPQDGDDIGNWLDTLGIASMFVEGSLIGLAVSRWVLLSGRR